MVPIVIILQVVFNSTVVVHLAVIHVKVGGCCIRCFGLRKQLLGLFFGHLPSLVWKRIHQTNPLNNPLNNRSLCSFPVRFKDSFFESNLRVKY